MAPLASSSPSRFLVAQELLCRARDIEAEHAANPSHGGLAPSFLLQQLPMLERADVSEGALIALVEHGLGHLLAATIEVMDRLEIHAGEDT